MWHIDPNDLGARVKVSEPVPSPCATVIVGLNEDSGQMYNAHLKFDLVGDKVVSVLGYFDGRAIVGDVKRSEIDSVGAREALMKRMDWPESANGLLHVRGIIFDPYFVGSETRAPAEAFLFTSGDGVETQYSGGFVVLGDGTMPVQGASLTDSAVGLAGTLCASNQSTAWLPEVVADQLLGTPAWVSLRGMGGFRDTASSKESAVHEFMGTGPGSRMFGDAAPQDHLVKTGEWIYGSRTVLAFSQQYAGVPVDGAYLTAEFEGNLLQEIYARLPYFPVFSSETVSQQDAKEEAKAINAEATCPEEFCEIKEEPFAEQKVIFVGELFDQPGVKGAHLAYRFDFVNLRVWWDATDNRLLRASGRSRFLGGETPNQEWSPGTATRTVCVRRTIFDRCERIVKIDPMVTPDFNLDIDLSGAVAPSPHHDSPRVRGWMGTIDTEMQRIFDWTSIMGDGQVHPLNPVSYLDIVVNDPARDLAASFYIVPNDDYAQIRPIIALGADTTAADVLAHEFGHHLTNLTYGPESFVEQGALGEHYSDVIAMTIFPHPDFVLGSETVKGTVNGLHGIRNMLDPSDRGTEWGPVTISHVADKANCDSTQTDCTYPWLGIPNRAFALAASGVPSPENGSSPLGLEVAAKLWFETVRKSQPYSMQSLDRFLNHRLKVLGACRAAIDDPAVRARVGPLQASDCRNVENAFDSVGIVAGVSHGFDRFPLPASGAGLSTSWTQTIHQGARLYQGCTISGHVLNAELRTSTSASMVSRSNTQTPPLFINVNGGELVAFVTSRCGSNQLISCTDPTNREVTYQVDSKWVGQPFVWINEQIEVPVGRMLSDCFVPTPGHKAVNYQSTPIVHTMAAGPFGKREDRFVAPNFTPAGFTPGACQLLHIGGIDEHQPKLLPGVDLFVDNWSDGPHGFRVSYLGIGPYDYTALHHTWVDGFSATFSRIVYSLAEPPGGNCDFPGLVRIP